MLKNIYYILAGLSGLISAGISITLKFKYWQYSDYYIRQIATKEYVLAWVFAIIAGVFIILIKCED